ncbi:MAG: hypothetical protein H6687_00715 [Bacillales bacterium]|nr:hypothetical protein [Bacillales bacterium]
MEKEDWYFNYYNGKQTLFEMSLKISADFVKANFTIVFNICLVITIFFILL